MDPEYIDASVSNGAPTGDISVLSCIIFVALAAITFFCIKFYFDRKNVEQAKHANQNVSLISINKSLIVGLSAILLAVPLFAFIAANAATHNYEYSASINAYVHNDGRIDFDTGKIACSKTHPLQFNSLSAKYSSDIFDESTRWTINFDNDVVYSNKIPGQYENDDLTYSSDIELKVAVDHIDPTIAKMLIGKSVVDLEIEMKSEGTAKFDTEPLLFDSLTYNGNSQSLLKEPGSANLGTIMYFKNTTDDEPTINDQGWTPNAQDVCELNAGTYYVWAYVKGSDNFESTDILKLGSTTINQANRDISLVDPRQQKINFIIGSIEPTYVVYNINDLGPLTALNWFSYSLESKDLVSVDIDIANNTLKLTPTISESGESRLTLTLKDLNDNYFECSLVIDIAISPVIYEIYHDDDDDKDYAMLTGFGHSGFLDSYTVPDTVLLKDAEGDEKEYQVKKIGSGISVFPPKEYGTYVETLVLNKNIKKIDNFAFSDSKISAIISPTGKGLKIEDIGYEAFKGCDKLIYFNTTQSNTFHSPDTLKSIGSGAFEDCANLQKINLDSALQPIVIGDKAFYNSGATSVKFNEDTKDIGYQAFVGTKITPENNGMIFDDSKRILLDARNINQTEIINGTLNISKDIRDYYDDLEIIAGGAFGDKSEAAEKDFIRNIVIHRSTDAKELYVGDQAFSDLTHFQVYVVRSSKMAYHDDAFKNSFTHVPDNIAPIFAGQLASVEGAETNLPNPDKIHHDVRSNAKFLGFKFVEANNITNYNFSGNNYYMFKYSSSGLYGSSVYLFGADDTDIVLDLNGNNLKCTDVPDSIQNKAFLGQNGTAEGLHVTVTNTGQKESIISKDSSVKDKDDESFFKSWDNTTLTLDNVTVKKWNCRDFVILDGNNSTFECFNTNIKECSGFNGSLFYLSNPSSKLIMDGCTFDGISSKSRSPIFGRGQIECSKCTFSNCHTDDTTGSDFNGGVFNIELNKDCSFAECNFYGNYADDNGGVFYVVKGTSTATFNAEPNLSFNNCVFGGEDDSKKNYVDDYHGGAVYAKDINIDIKDSYFINCKSLSGNGGALYCEGCNIDIYKYIDKDNSGFYKCFADDYGGALYIKNCKKIIIKDTNFNSNVSDDYKGGAIYAETDVQYSIAKDYKFEITGNSNFSYNVTNDNDHGDGGAIYCKQYNLSIVGASSESKILFKGNKSDYAGAAICFIGTENNAQQLKLQYCSFDNNEAYGRGGAVYCFGNIECKNSEFTTNKAKSYLTREQSGGAVYNTNNDYTGAESSFEYCNFDQNSADDYAGALCTNTLNKLTVSYCSFTSNSSSNSGGAIWAKNISNFILKGNNNNTFTDNHTSSEGKGEGGSMYVQDSTLSIFGEGSTLLFDSNYASNDDGGGIFAQNCLTSIENVKFKSNYAENCGGALCIVGGSAEIKDNTVFDSNHTTDDEGGAIYATDTVEGGLIISATSNTNSVSFFRNYAKSDDGGAIFTNSITLYLNNVEFKKNHCENQGGAIKIHNEEQGELLIKGYCNFSENYADDDEGGAIYAYCKKVDVKCEVGKGSVFYNNHSDNDHGGAIYLNRPSSSTDDFVFENVNFDSNEAKGSHYGGAIYYDLSINVLPVRLYNVSLNNNKHYNGISENNCALTADTSSKCYYLEGCSGQIDVYCD